MIYEDVYGKLKLFGFQQTLIKLNPLLILLKTKKFHNNISKLCYDKITPKEIM